MRRLEVVGVVVAAIAGGCGVVVDEATFKDRFPDEMCNRAIACLWEDVPPLEQCIEERRAVLDGLSLECDLYDGGAAGECLRDLRGLSCAETEYRFADAFPGQCAFVYVCANTTTQYF